MSEELDPVSEVREWRRKVEERWRGKSRAEIRQELRERGEKFSNYKEVIIAELEGLTKAELEKVADFIGYLKAKKRRKFLETGEKGDLLSVFGTMSGPRDLADQHDHYLYGWEKESDSGEREQ
jgi:hypothetical protein